MYVIKSSLELKYEETDMRIKEKTNTIERVHIGR